ncbi:MAG TPA: hypothetical protein PKK95_13965 [Vicinamibacterales bacterium]|nr:hypothetical protein [Acidobacteriota bacterium]HOC19374.1 hypothetical protein [Vicinamibacterales bacterium]
MRTDELSSRVRGEYLEMPGLSLTLAQAQRLWALDRARCSRLLEHLEETGFLRRRRDGSYVRRQAGVEPWMRATPSQG